MTDLFSRLAILLGLGLLVGLQRQRTDARLAGFRTFPLVTLLGAICALIGETYGGWIIPAGLVALAIITLGSSRPMSRTGEEPPGITSEVALLFMFAVGAYGMTGTMAVAIATTGVVAVLLHLKPQMHGLAKKIGDRDFKAIMQFALLSLVILPVLPDRTFGPLDILNPFKIWTIVVLIVGISLAGYIAYKLIGPRAGAWVNGVLGGLISSTATTVSVSRQSKLVPQDPRRPAFVILLASGIVFPRIAILLGTTAPSMLPSAGLPLAVMFAVFVLIAWMNLRGSGVSSAAPSEQRNPTELRSALIFGVLYMLVLLLVAVANKYLGREGLFAAAAVSGLTDMDAITISISGLVNRTEIVAGTGWRLVFIAALSNLAFKAAVVGFLGSRRLFARVLAGFAIAAAIGAALIWFAPA